MNPRYRSLTGAVVAVLALPVLLGLTACLPAVFPVPVGDPEKSRIDPYLTGIWFEESEETFYIFEPYDKRTWILSVLDVYEDDDYCEEQFAEDEEEVATNEVEAEADVYKELMTDLQHYGSDCYEGDYASGLMKMWRTKLGGEWFLTWEPLGAFDADTGFGVGEWLVFGIDKQATDRLRLRWIDGENPAWDKIQDLDEEDVTQRAVEKVIRKNAADEEFYDKDEELLLRRVLPEHLELLEDFLEPDW